jgi:Trp operon repressor
MRWQIVKQLACGTPQREIAKNLHVSIATITRGSRELLNKKGGFQQVMKKVGI